MTRTAPANATAAASQTQLKLLLPMPFPTTFDYLPNGDIPPPGTVLTLPFGRQQRFGVVWDSDSPASRSGPVAADKLRKVGERLDIPPVRKAMRRFIDRVAGYTMAPAGAVLRMALPPRIVTARAPVEILYRVGGGAPTRMTPQRRKALEAAADGPPRSAADLAEAAGVSEGVVRKLAETGALVTLESRKDTPYPAPQPDHPGPGLSPEQAAAAQALRDSVRQRGYSVSLLDGVTGSGKTEVYFEAVAEALRRETAQILVLLPEIALTSQWLDRFADRFGARPVEWHSDLSMAERRRAWHAVARGDARVVVGARSALFLPFADLSLIVVDEEHDPSYKQEDGVLYQGRDMAVLRAYIEDAPILLASATPSLESLVNVERGRYRHLRLEDRHGPAELPGISAIDMRRDPPQPGDWIAPQLADAFEASLARGEQTLFFLNRRGYAPVTVCRACGARLECPDCTAWLVEHRYTGQVQCHHCGFAMPTPDRCQSCNTDGALVPCGPGVERLGEEVLRRWPEARLEVMTSDTVTTPAKARALVDRIAAGAVDAVVGTQLITKGYHFPKLTLVGVIDADLGLRGGDLRAGERTWQTLMQVAGRAGRADHPGHVYLQTYDPEHPVTTALIAGDRDGFLAREAEARKAAGMPPFGRLAGIILSGPKEDAVIAAARAMARAAPQTAGIDVLGPAPAPLTRLRGQFRHRLLVRADRTVRLQTWLRRWLARVKLPGGVRLTVDIDPYSFL